MKKLDIMYMALSLMPKKHLLNISCYQEPSTKVMYVPIRTTECCVVGRQALRDAGPLVIISEEKTARDCERCFRILR